MTHPQQYTLCIDDLTLPARIGIDPHEYDAPQMITLNLRLRVNLVTCDWQSFSGVPCYATITQQVRQLAMAEHTDLCEQLAEKIAKLVFDNHLIDQATISIRKPHAVHQATVGVDMLFNAQTISLGKEK